MHVSKEEYLLPMIVKPASEVTKNELCHDIYHFSHVYGSEEPKIQKKENP